MTMPKVRLPLVLFLVVASGVAVALLTADRARAATFTVTSLNDAGAGSLRQAILDANAAAGGDAISFSVNGTITLTSGALPPIAGNLTITGPGSGLLTVSGNNASGVFQIQVGATVAISGLTITGGNAVLGGGILNSGGNLAVSNTVVTGNNASAGGGIHNTGLVTLVNSTVSNNSSVGGGGIFNAPTSGATVQNTTFSGNSADNGGAILNGLQSTLTVQNSTFSGNSAPGLPGFGGGIFNNGGTVTVTNSTFTGNSAADGGGIYNGNGTFTVTNSTFSGNTAFAVDSGGGIYNNTGATLTVLNSTFSGNSSTFGGGLANFGTANISFATFYGNTATTDGGNIYTGQGNTTSVQNTILTLGTPNNCGGNAVLSNFAGNMATDLSCSGVTQVIPAALSLGPLANNGGPTQTHALLTGSIAINAASACTDIFGASVTQDQRGSPRPSGPACDVGAYEFQAPLTPTPTATATATGTVSPTATGTITPLPTSTATRTASPTPILIATRPPNVAGAFAGGAMGTERNLARQAQANAAAQQAAAAAPAESKTTRRMRGTSAARPIAPSSDLSKILIFAGVPPAAGSAANPATDAAPRPVAS